MDEGKVAAGSPFVTVGLQERGEKPAAQNEDRRGLRHSLTEPVIRIDFASSWGFDSKKRRKTIRQGRHASLSGRLGRVARASALAESPRQQAREFQ